MEETQGVAMATDTRRWPWLYDHRFSILPNIRFRAADRWNTWSVNVHWLVFRVWTMDSPEIGAEVTFDGSMLQIRARFPYLITGVFIPFLSPMWVQRHFWRKSKVTE